MYKEAQISEFSSLSDLEMAIIMDRSLDAVKKQEALSALQSATAQFGSGTQISQVIASLSGTVLGFLISRYIGMSPVGQAVSSALGFGIGRSMYDFASALNSARGYHF